MQTITIVTLNGFVITFIFNYVQLELVCSSFLGSKIFFKMPIYAQFVYDVYCSYILLFIIENRTSVKVKFNMGWYLESILWTRGSIGYAEELIVSAVRRQASAQSSLLHAHHWRRLRHQARQPQGPQHHPLGFREHLVVLTCCLQWA